MSDRWNLQELVNRPIYALDFQVMIGDIVDFLDFSEGNIESQFELKLQAIPAKVAPEDRSTGLVEHLEDKAKFRFRVALPLRLRYAVVIALVTSIEWSVRLLVTQLDVNVPSEHSIESRTIREIRILQALAGTVGEEQILIAKDLIQIRNCIAHSAGLIRYDKRPEDTRSSVDRLDGFSLEKMHFLGEHVYIEKGALNPYAEKLKQLVVDLHAQVSA